MKMENHFRSDKICAMQSNKLLWQIKKKNEKFHCEIDFHKVHHLYVHSDGLLIKLNWMLTDKHEYLMMRITQQDRNGHRLYVCVARKKEEKKKRFLL